MYQWQIAGASLSAIEREFIEDNEMKKVDSTYFKELLHQVPATLDKLDDEISDNIDRPLSKMTPVELAVLRLGVYELMFRKDVPYRVVVNEAIDLAKRFGASEGHRYVNGVMDKIAHAIRADEIAS